MCLKKLDFFKCQDFLRLSRAITLPWFGVKYCNTDAFSSLWLNYSNYEWKKRNFHWEDKWKGQPSSLNYQRRDLHKEQSPPQGYGGTPVPRGGCEA